LTTGRGVASASRFLSAVQYARVFSGEVSAEWLVTVVAGVGFEKRLRANKNTPISRDRNSVPIEGKEISLRCCDIIALSFRQNGMDGTTYKIARLSFFSSYVLEVTLAQDHIFLLTVVYQYCGILERSAQMLSKYISLVRVLMNLVSYF